MCNSTNPAKLKQYAGLVHRDWPLKFTKKKPPYWMANLISYSGKAKNFKFFLYDPEIPCLVYS